MTGLSAVAAMILGFLVFSFKDQKLPERGNDGEWLFLWMKIIAAATCCIVITASIIHS